MKSVLTILLTVSFSVICLFSTVGYAADVDSQFNASHEVLGQVVVAPLKNCKQAAMLWTLKTQCAPIALGVGKVRSALKDYGIDDCKLDRSRPMGAILFYSKDGYPSLVSLAYLPTSDSQAVAEAIGNMGTSEKSKKPPVKIEKVDCCGVELIRVSNSGFGSGVGLGQKPWFIRTVGHWTFISRLDAALLELPKEPQRYGKTLTGEYLVGWQIRFDKLLSKQTQVQDEVLELGRQVLSIERVKNCRQFLEIQELLSGWLDRLPESMRTELKTALKETVKQAFSGWNSALAPVPNVLEGGLGIDVKSGVLFAQTKADFDAKRTDTFLTRCKAVAVDRPRFDFVLNSPFTFSAVGMAPETNVEWLGRWITGKIGFPKEKTGKETTPDAANAEVWREWGLVADVTQDGCSIGLGTTPGRCLTKVGKGLYELAAHGGSIPDIDARRWGLPYQGNLKRTGRHVVYEATVDAIKNDSRQSSVGLAFGPNECYVSGSWSATSISPIDAILSTRYQDVKIGGVSMDKWLFCGQVRPGRILSILNPDGKNPEKLSDGIVFKAGLKGDSIVARTEIQKDLLPSIVRVFESLAAKRNQ